MYNQASIYKGCGVYNLGDGASTKLPANTLRFLFSKSDYDPTVAGVGSSGTWQKVDTAAANVWDWTRNYANFSNSFSSAFVDENNLVEVIGAEVSSVTSFQNIFNLCSSLVRVCDLNTSSCTTFYQAFNRCTRLIEVGNIDTSSATTMSDCFFMCQKLANAPDITGSLLENIYNIFSDCSAFKKLPVISSTIITNCASAFRSCSGVESGIVDMYNQLSGQSTPPSNYNNCFKDCGRNSTTGTAELAQIPASWGGTAPGTLNMDAPQNLNEPLSPSVIDGDDSLTK